MQNGANAHEWKAVSCLWRGCFEGGMLLWWEGGREGVRVDGFLVDGLRCEDGFEE